MRSPVDLRRIAEPVLRATGLALLVLLLWRALPRDGEGRDARAIGRVVLDGTSGPHDATPDTTSSFARALLAAAATATGTAAADGSDSSAAVHVEARALGDARARGAIAALGHAGTAVSWSDRSGARGLAVGTASLPEPGGAFIVRGVADSGSSPLVLADDAGTLDSGAAPAGSRARSLVVRRTAGNVRARIGGSVAQAGLADSASPRRVLLFARPGWEAKFTVAALEEAGWHVDGTYAIAPRASVTVGRPSSLDTARYSVAIVLDSGVASAAALERFVRSGGGVVVAGDANRDRRLATLLPASPRESRVAVPGALLTDAPFAGLELVRLAPGADAVVLARDGGTNDIGGSPSVVVRRRGSGRVAAVGYRETWRWRMEGNGDAPTAHRRWWSALTRTVAYSPLSPSDSAPRSAAPGASAPWADLVARAGPPGPEPAERASAPRLPRLNDTALLLAALTALVLEWGLRRLRGAR